jgi:large subunit ribosomal protein L4
MSENNKNRKKSASKDHIILDALIYQENSARSATKAMKTRSEVRGGGVKPWRQKGTGRARQGSIRSVQWPGGGRAFGSSRAVFKMKLNKKTRAAALAALLDAKRAEGRIAVGEPKSDKPSTKAFIEFLNEKEITGKVLFIWSPSTPKDVIKSARNLPNITMLHATKINAKDILNSDWLLVCNVDAALLNPPAPKEETAEASAPAEQGE